jgi:hypothetical protein
MNRRGLLVGVLSAEVDCTNGGISARNKRLILVGEGVPQISDPGDDTPAIYLARRSFRDSEYLVAVATGDERTIDEKIIGPMFGGNFLWSSDSRFPSRQPIPIHDRFESADDYARNSD